MIEIYSALAKKKRKRVNVSSSCPGLYLFQTIFMPDPGLLAGWQTYLLPPF